MTQADAVQRFVHTAALWNVDSTSTESLIRAACDVLVADADGPAMRMLAAVPMSPMVSVWEVADLVDAALAELGKALPPRETEGAAEAAVRSMAARAVHGEIQPRELVAWAHRVIGHQGPAVAQTLVELDDAYDLSVDGYEDRTIVELDADTMREARRLADVE